MVKMTGFFDWSAKCTKLVGFYPILILYSADLKGDRRAID